MGLPTEESFYVPAEVLGMYHEAGRRGSTTREEWEAQLGASLGDHAAEWRATQERSGLPGWREALPSFAPGESIATRVALTKVLSALTDSVPGLVAGGADLTGNTGTALKGQTALSPEHPEGRQIHFGIREHAMGATMNGMALHGGLVPAGGTFLVFSDYMRPAVRLAALMGTKVLFAWSHDSVGVGEDGPTHQPVEQVAALRAIPQLPVVRPADANECAAAVEAFLDGSGPMALIMSRQNLPVLESTSTEGFHRGAYTLREVDGAVLTLVATGSEVAVALAAADLLAADGTPARVVSMPCWEWFEAQTQAYRDQVLPVSMPTLAVEAQVGFGWHRWAQDVVSIDRFGASAPGEKVLTELGITPEHVAARGRALLAT